MRRREGEEVSAFFSTNSPNQILALGLINLAADTMAGIYPANTLIETMLTNKKAIALYTNLFGEPDESMAICNGKIKV